MEILSDCTVSPPRRSLHLLWLAPLTLAVLLVHGYHPWAEDGGLYVAGVEYTLDPSLFPHETAFVTEHLRYSVFAPTVARAVRTSHLSLAAVLFAIYLLSTALVLLGTLRIAERCFQSRAARWAAVSLLAAGWTLPIAGTSLLLMDPYVTARSLSTPFSLLALAAALESQSTIPQLRGPAGLRLAMLPPVRCGLFLLIAAAFHPLMAGYALGFVIFLRAVKHRRPMWVWVTLVAVPLAVAASTQLLAKPEPASVAAAAYSRYYWFLSQWQWFECLGLLGPVLIFVALYLWAQRFFTKQAGHLCHAALLLAALAVGIALCFAQEHFSAHAVARLQPLRAFLLLYAVMILLLGGTLVEAAGVLCGRLRNRRLGALVRAFPGLFVAAMALIMFFVQRGSFPGSPHIELPGHPNSNPWVQAFVWAHEHTSRDSLFALDARYVNTRGEDAQTFRAIAERSAIPDFSKDGGEAAISPALAPEWQRSALATQRLSQLSDRERDARLRPFEVQWVVLHADAPTLDRCPYSNAVVKVCRLP